MDTNFVEFSNSFIGSKSDYGNNFTILDHSQHVFQRDATLPSSPEIKTATFDPFPSVSLEEESFDKELSSTLLNYIRQILLEEDMDEKACMFHDPLALQAAEKSWYDILGQKHPCSANQPPLFSENPDEHSCNSGTSTSTTHFVNPKLCGDLGSTPNGLVDPTSIEYLLSNIFTDPESILQFKRGAEEASKFLPKGNPLIIGSANITLPQEKNEEVEQNKREYLTNASNGRKNHERDDAELEDVRSNKLPAVYFEDEELSDMFDKVLLFNEGTEEAVPAIRKMDESDALSYHRRQNSQKKVVDLITLLIQCAQAVAVDDRRAANELLKQIRQHSSPSGDGSQRLSHYFANGLEARLAGNGTWLYPTPAVKRPSALSILNGYLLYLSTCPFKKIAIFYANHMIMRLSEEASKLHIIDFGIMYGFQWPILIQQISKRHGRPIQIRITGVELPESGFRPAERVEETGRHLAKFCECFRVPFEYNAIAKQWDTIRVEDLKIHKDEMLVVNCRFRFRNLLDETVMMNSPRNAVLNLIRTINPDMFIHGIINGSYNAPFFITRFKQALFHYSSLFDMLDVIQSREDSMRVIYEREFCGREIMCVIAREGSERVERPETYKQWQLRNMKAGFRQLPLNQELVEKLSTKVMASYHQDFMMNEDGGWLLTGWKGRVLYGISCWIPA